VRHNATENPSIAVIVLDTLRADAFRAGFDYLHGDTLAGLDDPNAVLASEITPSYDPADIGVARFSNAYSTAHWTVPAHASLFVGKYASEAGVHGRSPTLDCPEQTLAEAFSAAGYTTRCLSANPQLVQYDGWERGFDEFVRRENLGRTSERMFDWATHVEETDPGLKRYFSGICECILSDCDTLASLRHGYEMARTPSWDGGARAVRKRLDATTFGEQEFLFVNLMDAHTPYHPPPGENDPVTVVVADALAEDVDDPNRIREAYSTAVADLAEQYRAILARLHEDFEYVITLSDHGELLGEHGLWNHSIGLHPQLIHVPLVITGRNVDDETTGTIERGVHDDAVSILDVHRTAAELAGIEVDSRGVDLTDPSPRAPPRELLFESHGLLPFHESQFERKGLPASLFDHWQTPLAGFYTEDGAYCYETDPDSFRVLGGTTLDDPEARLRELVESLDRRSVGDADLTVSDEVRGRLEELGYA
jgi:arylsulfatase